MNFRVGTSFVALLFAPAIVGCDKPPPAAAPLSQPTAVESVSPAPSPAPVIAPVPKPPVAAAPAPAAPIAWKPDKKLEADLSALGCSVGRYYGSIADDVRAEDYFEVNANNLKDAQQLSQVLANTTVVPRCIYKFKTIDAALLNQLAAQTNIAGLVGSFVGSEADFALLGKLSGLEILEINGGTPSDQSPQALKGLAKLRRLYVMGEVTGAAYANYEAPATLEFIDFGHYGVEDGGVAHLSNAKKLTAVRLSSKMSDAGAKGLGQLTGLKKLELPSGMTASGLAELGGLTQLKTLDVGNKIDKTNASTLEKFQELEHLSLSVKDPAVFAALQKLPKLKRLSASFIDKGISFTGLAGQPTIEQFSLLFTTVDDAAFAQLASLPKLKSISLESRGSTAIPDIPREITDQGIAALAPKYPTLTDLRLHQTQITDQALTNINKCVALKSLDLSRTKVTDSGLKGLTLPNLTYLNLASNQAITDQSLEALSGCAKLGTLDVKDTSVTAEGVRKLKEARKGLMVYSNYK